jgi:hypothetical protein
MLLPNPFRRGYRCQIRQIHRSHVVRGANGSAMVVMFVDCCVGGGRYFLYYSYRRNPTGQEFFIPVVTIAVKLLVKISYSTKPTVILHFSTTAALRLWPTVQ